MDQDKHNFSSFFVFLVARLTSPFFEDDRSLFCKKLFVDYWKLLVYGRIQISMKFIAFVSQLLGQFCSHCLLITIEFFVPTTFETWNRLFCLLCQFFMIKFRSFENERKSRRCWKLLKQVSPKLINILCIFMHNLFKDSILLAFVIVGDWKYSLFSLFTSHLHILIIPWADLCLSFPSIYLRFHNFVLDRFLILHTI